MERTRIMVKRSELSLGLYEKALPHHLSWLERLELTRGTGFDFMEISIDESPLRLSRLDHPDVQHAIIQSAQQSGVPIRSMCLSAHRKYPLGSHDESIRKHGIVILEKALQFAVKLGVQRIQLAGYDVYYEESDETTEQFFVENLQTCVRLASQYGIILGFETMETPFMNTVGKAMRYVQQINSPYLQVYPDLGNLYNGNETRDQLYADIALGSGHLIAAHLKDTRPGVFRDLHFGEGQVHFKDGIEAFYQQGVRIFNCELWDDGVTDVEKVLSQTMQVVLSCLE